MPEELNYFVEKQKFTQWWLWIILCVFPFISVIPFEANEVNLYYVLIGFFIPLFFYLLELRIKVNQQGLYYQFFPIHFKYHLIRFDEIERLKPLKYNPLREYGGWGIKYGFRGKAYNLSLIHI